MKSLQEFPRIPLAVLPTPIQKLENISRLLGTNVWIKRDDLTGIGLGLFLDSCKITYLVHNII